jgi:hypothetical protein
LAISQTAGNTEQVSVPVTAGSTYFVRVFGSEGASNPSYGMTVNFTDAGSTMVYYLSTAEGGTLNSTDGSPSLTFADSDILKLTVMGSGQYGYERYFDGSDVGLTTSAEDIDAFKIRADGSILVSTTGSFSVPAAGGGTLSGTRHDLLRFVPTSLGEATAGEWFFYFDGSDVGLSTNAENVDAIAELSDGRLLISTSGAFTVPGVSGADEDLVAFSPTAPPGPTTTGTWAPYFDGSDVGLTANDAEDVDSLSVLESAGSTTLYLSTLGNFSVTGASGVNDDIVAFDPTSLGTTTAGSFGPGLAFDGGAYGLGPFNVDGFQFDSQPVSAAAVAQNAAIETTSGRPIPVIGTTTVRSRPSGRPVFAADTLTAVSRLDLIELILASGESAPALPGPVESEGNTQSIDRAPAAREQGALPELGEASRLAAWEHFGSLLS